MANFLAKAEEVSHSTILFSQTDSNARIWVVNKPSYFKMTDVVLTNNKLSIAQNLEMFCWIFPY